MTAFALERLLERAAGARIACVGDVVLDRFVYGTVERVSPEAPVPVLRRAHEIQMPGGAGNVARNLAAWGSEVGLAAVVGQDEDARRLEGLLATEPGILARLVRDESRPTTVKTRFVAAGQQLLRLDAERTLSVSGAAEAALAEAVSTVAAGASAILVSDYAKGAITPKVLEACRTAARRSGAPVLIDPKGPSFLAYGVVDLIKPNARELALVTGLAVETDQEVERALAAALDACEAGAVLVTRAGAGMSLLERGGEPRHFRGVARQVFDVSGAGDTVLAALGAARAGGASWEDAARLALLASGVVIGKIGTAVASAAELVAGETVQRVGEAGQKLVDVEGARAEVARWRARGLTIGFTNGCFDLLHRGHVSYLAEAAHHCDRLVVGLNSDASVRRLKGPERPITDFEGRALILAGLSAVDLVVGFDADTPLSLIEALRPDRLFKGADYTRETVVGAAEVEGWGGRLVLVALEEGHSTTGLITRMKERR